MFRRMILGVIATAAVMGAAGSAAAQVSVNIGINVPAPPQLVVVPASPVMYAPAVEANYFFYAGQYYVFTNGGWYVGPRHNGPWVVVAPEFIPDYLALVGDAADGYPGIAGLGPKTSATLINRHGHIEQFPLGILKEGNLERALLFKQLAILRTDAPLFKDVDELRWNRSTASFPSVAKKIGDARLATRVREFQNRSVQNRER